MARDDALIVGAVAAAVALLWPKKAAASINPQLDVSYPAENAPFDPWDFFDYGSPATPAPFDPWEFFDYGEPVSANPQDTPDDRLRAFLYALRVAETGLDAARSGESYFTFYGGSRFSNLTDHPVITREKQPVRLPDRFCSAAGLAARCYSTAAGAYQIIKPTWERIRKAGYWGAYLPDFSKASQDEAARRLLMEKGALELVRAGQVNQALPKIASVWASLPGATAEQGGKSVDEIQAAYLDGFYWG